jgi:D-arabinose 1-dehydrogenase-like Zn-dependent alcohol dehydrogenase
MKAAYYTGNQTFTIESVQPVEPREGEVQVGVAYCGICGTDLHVFHGAMDARVGAHRVIGHEKPNQMLIILTKTDGYFRSI